jgi:hypothetical protein
MHWKKKEKTRSTDKYKKKVFDHKKGRSYNTDNSELEQVDSLKHLGSVVNNDNAIKEEIKEKTAVGNKVFYANKKMMFSKLLRRSSKTQF